jgi:hypothetical protein
LFGFVLFLFFVRSYLGSSLLAPPPSLWMPLRVSTRLSAAMSGTTRNVVSLDSNSSSSGSLSMESVLAADAALGSLPFVSFAEIYKNQMRLRRQLDYMFEQVDGMQVKLDEMVIEVAALKGRRA